MLETAGSRLAQAFGYLTMGEVELLREVSRNLPPKPVIINIGAGAGTSSLIVAETREDANIYTVDISTGGWMGGMENEKNAFDGAGLSHRLPHQILSDSHKAGKDWQNGQYDMVIIDADHTFSGCMGDLDAWKGNLKPGGVILFHDYERPEWSDVKTVVDQEMTAPGWVFLERTDTYKAFKKC